VLRGAPWNGPALVPFHGGRSPAHMRVMTTNDTAGQVLLRCTDHAFTNFELRRRTATAQAMAAENMRGQLTFHSPTLASFVDEIDHREYLLEVVDPVLVVSNTHFGTTFEHQHQLQPGVPLGVAIAEGVLDVRQRLIGADVVQEVGALEFDDPNLFRACHRDHTGAPVIVVNAGRYGWVQMHLAGDRVVVRSVRSGRRILARRRAVLTEIGKRVGAGTPDGAVTTLHGVASQVLDRAEEQPAFWARNPAA